MNMQRNRRLHRALTLRMWVERIAPALAVCGLLLMFGWCTATQWDSSMDQCLDAYARARTAADSAGVDRRWLSARSRFTCGDLCRDGTLDRQQAAMRQGRTVMEK
jgi:hypothetical protein